MADLSQVQEHADVIGADGVHVGTVDHVEGDRIKLTKTDSTDQRHHYISGGLVAAVDDGGTVRLSANADVAILFEEYDWLDTPTPTRATLHQRLEAEQVAVVPLVNDHREALRAACAADAAIWDIYPVSMIGEAYDATFDDILAASNRLAFAVLEREDVVGTTSFFLDAADPRVVEIGGTYIMPGCRGTGFNASLKRLMINHAFGLGIRRIEFRVDTRNARSMAAIRKLGAVPEGVLRANRTTWTGFVRDTAVFGLLADEWTA